MEIENKIDPNRALSVEGMAYMFFYLISRVKRYEYMLARLKSLKLDPESKKYLNEHEWNFDDFKAPTLEHSIMARAILTKNVEEANQFYTELKNCFIQQFGPFWGQIHLNSIFLDYSTRKVFIREKILETIASIASLPDKDNKVIYFLNTGAGVDNTVQLVIELCQIFGIKYKLIELDTPDMSKFKSKLMGSLCSVTYIPCDLSEEQNIFAFGATIQELLRQNTEKNVHLLNLSEGLTPYVTEKNMNTFNAELLKYFTPDRIYQFLDSIVLNQDQAQNDQILEVAKKYFGAFKSTVKNEEEFIAKYGLGCGSEKYNVFHPASEITISREYKTTMLFKILESVHIPCNENIPTHENLDSRESEVRQYYESLKQDQVFGKQVEDAKEALLEAESQLKIKFGEEQGNYNDFELVAMFNDIYKTKTKSEFSNTELASSLFELSNACQSAKYLWNETLATKTENLNTSYEQEESTPYEEIKATLQKSEYPDLAKALDERRETKVYTKSGVANTFVDNLKSRRSTPIEMTA